MDDGPLLVTARIPITRADGTTDEVCNRVALCRCDESANKPYCDGTHATVGFSDSSGADDAVTDSGEPEQLSSGPEREPRWSPRGQLPGRLVALRSRLAVARWVRARRVRAAASLVVVAATGFWLVDASPEPGAGASGPRSTPSAGASGTPGQQYVEVGEICPPVTDGLHTLVVSFTLRNISTVPVTVRSVQPLLPLAGLDTVATDISGGTCSATTGAPADLDLPAGGSLVVTFRFLLPGTCPQALPILARTKILVGPASSGNFQGAPGVSVVQNDVGVLDDLGAIRFADCPAAG
jgi:CDGSH-type Zn-finger protein